VTPGVAAAVDVLRAGGLVAIPTETVYGLGADAANDDALRRVYRVKGRPADHPLIVHVGPAVALEPWALLSPLARRLADAFWPGPLTLIVPRGPLVSDLATGGRATVGVRVPAHPIAIELLDAFGAGVAAPSANRFGRVSPTTADHVRADLGSDVDLVLDGGPCTVGIESTIVDCTGDRLSVLRPGGIDIEAITAVVGPVSGPSGPSRAAGMLPSHYAPRATVEVVERRADAERRAEELRAKGERVAVEVLAADAASARRLYAALRAHDEATIDVVVVVLPPDQGLGHALRDRLQKAAARPRTEESDP
jgi:L-threonylcarbamoyladenylate synthase